MFFLITNSQTFAINFISLILLPGTIIHEVSHMLIAELLRVKTYEFSFIPEIIEKNHVKAGSLQIQKTDPLRHTLIGLSPIIFGLSVIFAITNFFFLPIIKNISINNPPTGGLTINNIVVLIIFIYLLLTISNTMFSSKSDLKASIYPLIFLVILILAMQLAGISIKINFSEKILASLANIFQNLSIGLGITFIINLINLFIVKVLLKTGKSLFSLYKRN